MKTSSTWIVVFLAKTLATNPNTSFSNFTELMESVVNHSLCSRAVSSAFQSFGVSLSILSYIYIYYGIENNYLASWIFQRGRKL